SFFMRLILRLLRHEGYSYDVDVFDKSAICNDPDDPWSANCAIPNMLFDNPEKFEAYFPFRFQHHRFTEFIIFPLSGGVNSKIRTVNLPKSMLKIIDKLDDLLIFLGERTFPMQRQ